MIANLLGPWTWPVTFALTWALYFFNFGWRSFRRYWIGGAVFASRALWFDVYFTNRGFWRYEQIVLPVLPFGPGVEWLALLGPYFAIGTVMFQWLPWRRRELLLGYALMWAAFGTLFDSIGIWAGLATTSALYRPIPHGLIAWLTWEGFHSSKFFALGLDTDHPGRPRGFQWGIWIGAPALISGALIATLVTLLFG